MLLNAYDCFSNKDKSSLFLISGQSCAQVLWIQNLNQILKDIYEWKKWLTKVLRFVFS